MGWPPNIVYLPAQQMVCPKLAWVFPTQSYGIPRSSALIHNSKAFTGVHMTEKRFHMLNQPRFAKWSECEVTSCNGHNFTRNISNSKMAWSNVANMQRQRKFGGPYRPITELISPYIEEEKSPAESAWWYRHSQLVMKRLPNQYRSIGKRYVLKRSIQSWRKRRWINTRRNTNLRMWMPMLRSKAQ